MAITNNLNFGNPEKPEIMAQLKGCIEGMAHACGQLHYPVVSGNVSLYNETIDQNIYPTPAIGGVGIIDDYRKALPMAFQRTDEHIFLVGKTHGHLGQSLFIKILYDSESGAPPPCDPVVELRHGAFIRELAETGLASACHDLSDGGLMMALAEMAMAGEIGARIHVANEKPEFWFGEDQGRYLLVTSSADAVIALAQKKNIPLTLLGRTAGDCLVIGDDDPDQKATHKVDMKKNIPSSAPPQERPLSSWKQIIQISVTELRCLHEKFFDEYFND